MCFDEAAKEFDLLLLADGTCRTGLECQRATFQFRRAAVELLNVLWKA